VSDRETLSRIDAAARAGDLATAARLADAAVKRGIEHPLPYIVLGHSQQQLGRFDEAIAFYARATQLDPNDAGLFTRLAGCLDAARRPREALTAYDTALARNPRFPPALEGKARVLSGDGRAAEARTLFNAALTADPKFLAAMMGLAHLSAEAGDWADAKAACERALKVEPNFPEALWLLAQAQMADGKPEAAEARLRTLLADPRLTPFQRADARLELGDALHAQSRWDDAFAAYAEGKAAQHQLYAQRAASRERETARAGRLATWLETTDVSKWPADSGGGDHVFLLGFPRSGTTLLEQALAGHPRVVALEERPTLTEASRGLFDNPGNFTPLAQMSEADAEARRVRYWEVVREFDAEPQGGVFVDKQPGGAIHLPLIRRLFPKAKVLFAVRDPRDVALSCLRQNFQLNALTYEFTALEDAAACYDAFMRLAEASRAHLDLAWRDVRHEDLIADFEGRMRDVCVFVGLDWSPAMTEFAETAKARSVRTPSASQVRAGLTDTGVGRWRDYARHLTPVLPALAPWVERFGYDEV
jgi:tetratricopeptide (TPR) repeat protein